MKNLDLDNIYGPERAIIVRCMIGLGVGMTIVLGVLIIFGY